MHVHFKNKRKLLKYCYYYSFSALFLTALYSCPLCLPLTHYGFRAPYFPRFMFCCCWCFFSHVPCLLVCYTVLRKKFSLSLSPRIMFPFVRFWAWKQLRWLADSFDVSAMIDPNAILNLVTTTRHNTQSARDLFHPHRTHSIHMHAIRPFPFFLSVCFSLSQSFSLLFFSCYVSAVVASLFLYSL